MRDISIIPNRDLLLIKWQLLVFVFGLVLAAIIFIGVEHLYDESRRDLQLAQANLASARNSVDQIEEEEDTIIRYIDRYQELEEQDVIREEDRLAFLERVAEIRARHDLFPIELNIEGQNSLRLQYDPQENDPGGPVDLHSSRVEVFLPLLHEGDLARLLDGILNGPGLFQATDCQITLRNREVESYFYLAQHMDATCNILWYTFDIEPPVENTL